MERVKIRYIDLGVRKLGRPNPKTETRLVSVPPLWIRQLGKDVVQVHLWMAENGDLIVRPEPAQ